ncbi:hypothetical protein [Paenibacillus nasutitermitis]|uniref:Methyltransferase n=1 Tax=Paenibacillus nasutitermitis TaxID=1652958 RepID=A0A917DSW0_9BACL|nr:hypothetical protein [Paenibacillus nasutitermitis]GGD63946.1 hypothetical protein GCM10010911_22090 [Paenibacillus nasutitermitis]
MSRSWERKIQKNQSQLNKQRKKQGKAPLVASKSASNPVYTYKGRSILMPAFLLVFTAGYTGISLTGGAYKQAGSMFWITIACYVFLALLFMLRRPYLSIGKDFVRSRRFTGDRTLFLSSIKGISVQKGSIIIEQPKGGNWIFTRLFNRYPTDEMTERLRAFAAANDIPFAEK